MNAPANGLDEQKPLKINKVLTTWLPLAASWMLMSFELPTINAIIARLANPEVNLAAYGGVVFPIALMIEAPVVMLLAASTAMSRDWKSYQKLKWITLWMGGSLAALHFLIAITPAYYFIVNVLLEAPTAVVEPGRMGLILLTPWTMAIAYRRFQQGAMIRFGHSRMVGETTLIRLTTGILVLTVGMVFRPLPGAALAGLTQGLAVSAEAIYAGLRIRKIRPVINSAPDTEKPLKTKRFIAFYYPLALTSFLSLSWLPLISATVSRMPAPIESLAVWSVITGLFFMFRASGIAYNEAVVALLEERCAIIALRKFAWVISTITVGVAILFATTPVSYLWFTYIANLPVDLVVIARLTLFLGIPLPFLSIFISYYQGIIVNFEKTGPIAEAVVIFIVSLGIGLLIGMTSEVLIGVYVAAGAFTFAHLTQMLWLILRSRIQRRRLLGEI